ASPARPVSSLQPRGARPRPAPSREDLNPVENDSQKRTAVAFGLIFLLTAVYMTWFAPSTPPHTASAAADAGTVVPTAAPAPPPHAPPRPGRRPPAPLSGRSRSTGSSSTTSSPPRGPGSPRRS